MIVLGLTGSIGMGKTATARLFAEEGALVQDADATVHTLYAAGGAAAPLLRDAFPGAVNDGEVDRAELARQITADPQGLARLEAIVHPLVAEARAAFVAEAERTGAEVVVLDIPLLFEVGAHDGVDAVVVASAPSDVQRERVLARPGMTPERFEALLARQIPDAHKRAKADFVVDTSAGFDAARDQVRAILKAVRAPGWRPNVTLARPDKRPH